VSKIKPGKNIVAMVECIFWLDIVKKNKKSTLFE
jgi:hypothetical protein